MSNIVLKEGLVGLGFGTVWHISPKRKQVMVPKPYEAVEKVSLNDHILLPNGLV